MSRDGIGGTITGVRAGVKTPFRARNLPDRVAIPLRAQFCACRAIRDDVLLTAGAA